MLLDPAFAEFYAHSDNIGKSIEVPCQQCGRIVSLSASGQRVALGDPEPVVELDLRALARDEVKTVGDAEIHQATVPVICMWCMFEGNQEVIAALDERLAEARQQLAERGIIL